MSTLFSITFFVVCARAFELDNNSNADNYTTENPTMAPGKLEFFLDSNEPNKHLLISDDFSLSIDHPTCAEDNLDLNLVRVVLSEKNTFGSQKFRHCHLDIKHTKYGFYVKSNDTENIYFDSTSRIDMSLHEAEITFEELTTGEKIHIGCSVNSSEILFCLCFLKIIWHAQTFLKLKPPIFTPWTKLT
uniref:Uncharacterized protein n=1 Tax=Ditylenchus dipsaci TaxID=166011 RepID=A0A915DZR9_9BILA